MTKKADDTIEVAIHQHEADGMRHLQERPARASRVVLSILLACAFLTTLGCASLNPWKDDEYVRAKNSIEGYQDAEGNWIRPEGSRADRRRNSDLPKVFRWIPGVSARPVNRDLAKKKYQEADEIFNRAKELEGEERRAEFRKAAKKYTDAGKDWVSSELEQNTFWMAGESYYFAEDYSKAEDQYVKLMKEYPRNPMQDRVDQRRVEIGNYWLQFNDKFYNINFTDNKKPWNDTQNHGKRVLEKVRLDNPIGRLADDVTMKIAETEFQRENWDLALDAYQDLIATYPDSPFQFDAHFLGVKSALLAYQGPQYSVDPLEKAEALLKQMTRQFPDRCRAEGTEEKIREAFAEVRYRKAEREWDQVQYRVSRDEVASARIYCKRILDDYPDTPFAEKAKEVMGKMEGKADVPTPHLYWMTKVFPSRDKIKPLIKPIEKVNEERMAQRNLEKPNAVMANGSSGAVQR